MNTKAALDKIAQKYTPLSKTCQEELVANSKIRTFKRGEIVVREGQYAQTAYLITQGCARAYYLQDGRDISDWFTFENEIMTSIVSFFTSKPSPHFVEFIEDSVAIEFSKETMDQLSSKHHDFERFISKAVTDTMLGLCERLHTIQFVKAEERFTRLLKIYPDITNRVPLTHIASYLGITLETLSRIRNPKKARI